jgi:hypothetical protein
MFQRMMSTGRVDPVNVAGWVMGSSARSMNKEVAGVSEKSHTGDDRRIPPFKKRRVGHPARNRLDSPGENS